MPVVFERVINIDITDLETDVITTTTATTTRISLRYNRPTHLLPGGVSFAITLHVFSIFSTTFCA